MAALVSLSRNRVFACVVSLLGVALFAQQGPQAASPPGARSSAGASGAPASSRIKAIVPQRDPNLIFVEGEDAISTNFARGPILNYDCSGFRTLQLNQSASLSGNSVYFADFAFYADSTGTYELWYGGTPPANKDEAQVSYASPFNLVLDKTSTFEIYRDSVHVVENYTPGYYWNLVGDFPIQRGSHRLRFEVPKPRNYDGKYFFYLDNFFLIKKENGQRLPIAIKPAVFPHNMDDRSIDRSFYSLDEYQKRIKDNPNDTVAPIELSMVYSMIGDYYNALKYLRRADLLNPQQKNIMLLMAKNTLWKGDTVGALALYKNLLQYYGDDVGIWLEAGKVAAWTGQYADSIAFYTDALKKFPKNLSLIVNRGLSELWSGAVTQARQDFASALELTGQNVGERKTLASIYSTNGYPDRAAPIYRDTLSIAPGDVELYTLLYETLQKMNLPKDAEAVKSEMENRFIPSPELTAYLEVFDRKIQLKAMVLQDYQRQLAVEPDNLDLRKIIAEADFWNGDKEGGIKAYESIMANYVYLQLRSMEKKAVEYMGILDRALVYSRYLADLPQQTALLAKRLGDQLAAIRKAQADLVQKKAADADLVKKGKPADLAGENALNAKISQTESELGGILDEIDAFSATAGILSDRFKADQDREGILSQEDDKQEKVFLNLTKDTHWKWNRDATERELEKARQNGTVLASYAMGRIALFEGDAESALRSYDALAKDQAPLAGVAYGLVEARLLYGQMPPAGSLAKSAADTTEPFATLNADLTAYLGAVQEAAPSAPGFLTGDPAVAVTGGLKTLASMRDASFAQKTVVDRAGQEIHNLLSKQLERNFFDLAQNTSNLHNELGDFYQTDKRYSDAIDQFRQVMAIDPWNRQALFKLGQVYQYNGNWSQAQALYRKVYNDDPFYNNVAHFYNQIERMYADQIDTSTQVFADTTRYSQTGTIDWGTHFGERVGIVGAYDTAYQRFPVPPGYTSLTHRLTLSLPLTPFGSAFTLTPFAGGLAYTPLAGAIQFSGNIDPYSFFGSFVGRPLGGLSASLGGKAFSTGLSYNVDTIEDTVTKGAPLYAQTFQANLSLLSILGSLPYLGESSLRISGQGQRVEDGAIVWTAGGELALPFTLSNVPHLVLSFNLPLSYQDSLNVPSNSPNYYAPRQTLSAQGSLALRGDFDVAPGFAIHQTLRGAAGYYGEQVLTTDIPPRWVHADSQIFNLEGRSEFSTELYTIYMDISGSAKNQMAPQVINLNYWSFAVELGIQFRAPTFLVP